MITYAQNLEDVLLARYFRDEPPQLFIDVGAGHPAYHSVTKHFYDSGWRGINVEPRPSLFQLLKEQRPEDRNLNCAVSANEKEVAFFEVNSPEFMGEDAGGLSTLDAQRANEYRAKGLEVTEYKTRILSLSTICGEQGVSEIGFLKVDVEGLELEVISSLDFARWRPRVIVAESTLPTTSEVCDDEVQAFLESKNYIAANYDGLNRFYVREEDQQHIEKLRTPANVTDGYISAEEISLRHQIEELSAEVLELHVQNESLRQNPFLKAARRLRKNVVRAIAG